MFLRKAALLLAIALTAAPALARTPSDQLIIAQNLSQMITLDPGANSNTTAEYIIAQVYETLFRLDPTDPRRVLPMLAEGYELSPDQRVYTIRLRTDARFASGNPVTAEDAAWSIQRLIKLAKGADTNWAGRGFTAKNIDKLVRAVDTYTLRIELPEPTPPSLFLYTLAVNHSVVVDRKTAMAHAQGDDFGNQYLTTTSAGSGPFRLVRWRPNDLIVLERVAPHWRQTAPMRRILIRHIPEAGVRALLMRTGEVDAAFELIEGDLNALIESGKAKLLSVPDSRVLYLALNQKDEQLRNPAIAQALKRLVDYDGLERTVMQGQGFVHQGFAIDGTFGDPKLLPFHLDVAEARRILEQSGLKLPIHINLVTQPISPFVEIAQSLKAEAAKAGIEFEIQQMVGAQLWPKLRSRQYDAVLAGWSSSYPDAHAMAETFIINPDNRDDASFSGRPAWRAAWRDEKMMADAERASMLDSPAAREQAYVQLHHDFFERAPILFLFQIRQRIALAPNVDGFVLHAFGLDMTQVVKQPEHAPGVHAQ